MKNKSNVLLLFRHLLTSRGAFFIIEAEKLEYIKVLAYQDMLIEDRKSRGD